MKIIRIYNNNVIEARESDRTVILQGKGIGFGKKSGDDISVHVANRIFELVDKKHYQMMREILEEIPEEYWGICVEIQEFVEKKLAVRLNTNFYLSMLDHVYIAVKRAKKGIHLTSTLGTEIELYFKDIYEVARQIVEMTESRFDVSFDNSEIYFISTHLLEAVLNVNYSVIRNRSEDMAKIIEMKVDQEFGDAIDKASPNYARFWIHVKRFLNAVLIEKSGELLDTKFENLYHPLKDDYKRQNSCVNDIIALIEQKYNCEVGVDERFYLLIHIIKISEG